MMMAEIGDIRKLTGKRIEIAPTGPIPGRTPINVPNKTPTKQKRILAGWSPIENPCRRLYRVSSSHLPPGIY